MEGDHLDQAAGNLKYASELVRKVGYRPSAEARDPESLVKCCRPSFGGGRPLVWDNVSYWIISNQGSFAERDARCPMLK